MEQKLEDRIRILEDMEAIKKLKALYCLLVDAGIAGDLQKVEEFLDLFTDDAKGEYAEFGTYEGKEALTGFFRETVVGLLSYAAHKVHNPVIEVSDNKAKGTWYFEVSLTVREGNRAAWMQGIYEEDYVKIKETWKFQSIKATFDYFTPFEEGWAKTKWLA